MGCPICLGTLGTGMLRDGLSYLSRDIEDSDVEG